MQYRLILIFLVIATSWGFSSSKQTVASYIEQWKPVAIKQMQSHQIPASIIMAQGILESSFGNSDLAVKANNHFGIKCHGWEGAKIYKDDDAKNECFRKYPSAAMSYEDHSLFLTSRPRYAGLFQLEITDYSGWAHGLKAAGYATNPKYAHKLIELIERYDLQTLDVHFFEQTEDLIAQQEQVREVKTNKALNPVAVSVAHKKREVLVNANRSKYVVAKDGDTFYQLALEMEMTLRQLHKYNDFPPNKDYLKAGDIIYITPKRNRSRKMAQQVKMEKEAEMWELSQQYGLKLKRLMQINAVSSPNFAMQKGEVVHLR